MESRFYELIGRFIAQMVWFRYSGQIKIAGGVLAALTVLGGLVLARRTPPEG